MIVRHEVGCPFAAGGVWGSVKLNSAITTEKPAASRNGVAVRSTPMKPTISPITIQPMVANTRMSGNWLAASVMFRSVSEFVSAIVGK